MNKNRFSSDLKFLRGSLLAVLTVMVTTIPLYLIGRDTLGEAVIALVYLVPVVWSAYRWGQLAGISAALTAALAFDFLFIPPFYTFTVARLEGWLVLAIFLIVAMVVVERIQASLTTAHEAVFEYELCSALSSARTPDAVAQILARQIQQLFQASLVRVSYQCGDVSTSKMVSQPEGVTRDDRPDRLLPVLNSWGLVSEIQLWRGNFWELPPEDSALLQNFAMQAARAFERTECMEKERTAKSGK